MKKKHLNQGREIIGTRRSRRCRRRKIRRSSTKRRRKRGLRRRKRGLRRRERRLGRSCAKRRRERWLRGIEKGRRRRMRRGGHHHWSLRWVGLSIRRWKKRYRGLGDRSSGYRWARSRSDIKKRCFVKLFLERTRRGVHERKGWRRR